MLKSLQYQARVALFKSNIDYTCLPNYLLYGLPNIKVLERMRYSKDPNDGLKISAEQGCLTSFVFFKSLGATHVEWAMNIAAGYGHIDIVIICKEWGARSFDMAMGRAAAGGYIDIVRLCRSWGVVYNLEWSWEGASYGGHYDIVKLLLEWDDRYINTGLRRAAMRGHVDVVRLLVENGATDFGNAILKAAEYGHIEIIKMFKELSVVDEFDDAMIAAARHGHIEVVKLCKEYGAVEFALALKQAKIPFINRYEYVDHTRYELRNLLKEWKDTHCEWVMNKAALTGDVEREQRERSRAIP